MADAIREQLRIRRWSVRHLARRSGVDHSTISRILGGERMPSITTVRKVAAAFDSSDAAWQHSPALRPQEVRAVVEALGADPALDAASLSDVVRLYLRLRAEPVSEVLLDRRLTS
jgi:transcriptional regulator with XRE-family HTH domain